MKKTILVLILAVPLLVGAQNKLTLQYCLEQAELNYPLIDQKELIDQYELLKTKSLNKNYLPKIDLNGRATYQSDVTQLELELPPNLPFQLDFPEVDKSSYKATIDVTQIIYDGGTTKNLKLVEEASAKLNHKNLETELYKIKNNINQLFFGIVLLEKQKNILEIAQKNLEQNVKKLESGFRHGVILESEVNIIKAEIIKIKQSLVELKATNSANKKMLEEFINQQIPDDIVFELPELTLQTTTEITRPEMQSFELSKNNIEASKNLMKTKTKPLVSAFAQAGYGKPGLNMLSNEADEFYFVGLNFTWRLWDWNQNKSERALLDINSSIIETQKATFEKNIKIANSKALGDIQKWDEMISMDNDIIKLRSQVRVTKESQLENGIITSTEYIRELNNETQAKLDMEVHRIQLSLSIVNYMNNNGQITELQTIK